MRACFLLLGTFSPLGWVSKPFSVALPYTAHSVSKNVYTIVSHTMVSHQGHGRTCFLARVIKLAHPSGAKPGQGCEKQGCVFPTR